MGGEIFSHMNAFSQLNEILVSTTQAQKNIKEFKMAHEQATSTTLTSKKLRTNFRWEENHVEDLINCIITYKTKMTYRGLDFDGDKPQMYRELTESVAEIYQDVDAKIFGPANVTDFNENTKSNVD